MKPKLIFTLLGFSLSLSGATIRAQTAPAPEMTYESVKADYLKADAELNKVYQETLARLSPPEREELKGYQRAWIKLREDRTGEMQDGIGKWNDRASFTKERIDFLFETGSAYLFRRKSSVEFEKATIKPFDDMAWDFLARCFAHSEKNKGVTRDQLRRWGIEFDSWTPDSRKLRVSLSGLRSVHGR
jgi:uncharacterized protein YecT (DUF1311 family)